MKAVIIGYGSIGKRHATNIKSLGHDVIIVEPVDNERNKITEYKTYSSISDITEQVDIAIICSPTQYHLLNATESMYIPGIKGIFIEKPISYNMDRVINLVTDCTKRNIKLMGACNLRFNNGISLVKTLLNKGNAGKPLYVDYFHGHDLRKWHPEIDYRSTYSAGEYGGILLDDIHSVDLFIHLFGEIIESNSKRFHTRQLDIINDDIFEGVFTFKNGMIGHIHSDYLAQDFIRNMQIICTNGVIQWDYVGNVVNIKTNDIEEWRSFATCTDPNFMYVKEIEHFISCIQNDEQPITNGVDALVVAMESI